MTLETGVKELAEAVGADVKALDTGKVNSNDPRLTDSREWSADTVTQAEAEAGTASTRRAWSAQRVRQAINAWWQLVTSGFGRNFIAASNEQAARNALQLGSAATSDVATNAQALAGTAGVLPDAAGVHAAFKQFGYGGQNPLNNALDCNDLLAGSRNSWPDGIEESTAVTLNLPALGGSSSAARSWHVECFGSGSSRLVQEATEVFGANTTRGRTFTRVKHDTVWYPWVEVMRTGAYGLGEQSLAGRPATQLNWNAFFGMNVVAINSSGPFMSYLGISQNTAQIINDDGNNLILNEELLHTGNTQSTTGQSTEYPMSQKAVTDAINNSSIGVGQTWQDVTGSRAEGTVYTNTTGKPIFVSVTAGEAIKYNDLYVDGVLVARGWLEAPTAIYQPLQAIVPNGSEYYLEYTGEPDRFALWAELR